MLKLIKNPNEARTQVKVITHIKFILSKYLFIAFDKYNYMSINVY